MGKILYINPIILY